MKKLSVVISSALLAGLIVYSSCNSNNNTPAATPAAATPAATGGSGKIAYVNIDTLEEKYEPLKAKKEEFKHRQDQIANELQQSYDMMQRDAAEVQKKVDANTITQSEYEAAGKRLSQMQRSLETRKQALTEQLMKDQTDFNMKMKADLDSFIEEYNKTKHYDYILSYSASGGSSIIYANKEFEITKDVVEGMNAKAKNDAVKKK